MVESKINNLVSIAIFLLHNEMLSSHKKVKMVLEMKSQDKTKSKRRDCVMQKNDSRKARSTILKEKASVLKHFHCNKGIFSGSRVPGLRVWISGSRVSGSQGAWSQGLIYRVSGLRIPSPGSQVLILDYAV